MPTTKTTKDIAAKEKWLLLDLSSLVYRAYHALPPLTAATGEPAGALYGFLAILLKELKERKPTHVIAARDLPGKTFRHEAYAAYKATRPKTPDDLVTQLRKSVEMLEAAEIPVLGAEGFEADDVIATVAASVRRQRPDARIEVLSNDADILQLVDDRLTVVAPRRGVSETVAFTPERVREKYGIPPKLIPAFKALSGDPSDNIEGLAGVGPKTATELLAYAGSLEALLNAADAPPPNAPKPLWRFAPLLREGAGELQKTEALATLRSDAPAKFEFDEAEQSELVSPGLVAWMKRYGFEALVRRVGASRKSGSAKSEEGMTPEDREQFITAQEDDTRKEIDRAEESGMFSKGIADLERKLTPVISAMERRGVFVDREELGRLRARFQEKRASLERGVYELAGREFNLASPKQLAEVLFNELNILSRRKTAKGQKSTAAAVLEELRGTHPVIDRILAWREVSKLLSTYVETLPDLVDSSDGRIHAKFWQLGTATGRISSSDPNLQNIPLKSEDGRAVRKVFCAPEGKLLLAADYEQIELRVAAVLAQDPAMLEAFRRGDDIHAATAARIFHVAQNEVAPEMRRRAKILNFGILYGMGPRRVSRELGASFEEAQAFLAEYFAAFPALSSWMEQTKAQAALRGYTETAFGRKRFFPELQSANAAARSQAERAAVNAPIQGTATGDLIKKGMVALAEGVPEATMIVQVHDEILCEVDAGVVSTVAVQAQKILESVWPEAPIPLPVRVTSGKRWGNLTALTAATV